MSRTQYYVAQSLDGFIAERGGGLDWLLSYGASEAEVAEATEGAYERFFAEVGAVAMGSATYEFLLAEGLERWPYEGMTSWVFTTRELPVPWEGADVRFARGPVEPVHEQLRAASSHGCGSRARGRSPTGSPNCATRSSAASYCAASRSISKISVSSGPMSGGWPCGP